MIGTYSSIGIVIKPDGDGWWIRAPFQDGGFCDNNSTEGEIMLRYLCHDLATGLDTIKADVERMGIAWAKIDITPTIYMHQDGEDPATQYPTNWREIVAEQCKRLGWRCVYEVRR